MGKELKEENSGDEGVKSNFYRPHGGAGSW